MKDKISSIASLVLTSAPMIISSLQSIYAAAGPIGWVIALIGALALAMIKLVPWDDIFTDEDTKALQKSEAAVKNLTAAVNELKTKMSELSDMFDEYKTLIDELN